MIKAKDLVWEEFGGFIRAESIHGAFYEIYTERLICALLFGKGDRIWSCECKALEEAKAACQAHYQSMVESMVDIGHLKKIIKDAVSFGFKRGHHYHHYQPELWRYENARETAIEAFLKTLEQKGG